jgi:pimeloyl-ACP methyl ester carboxylesterase
MADFNLDQYIERIELNGLKGRMVNAPASIESAKKVNILFVHGHHSSHERLQGVVELLQRYGNVCLPDLPGFGGMTSLFSIDEKPTTDNLADYLAAFIKLHYGTRKKFIIVGYSMGFMVTTRLLQKYPAIRKQILDVVAVAGLVHNQDFMFSPARRRFYTIIAKILIRRIPAFFVKFFILRKWFLSTVYTRSHNAKNKFANQTREQLKASIDFEVNLWRINDVRTWCFTTLEMFKCDLTTGAEKMPLNVLSVVIDGDRYFNNATTEMHLKDIYNRVKTVKADVTVHGGSKVETADEAAEFLPKSLRTHLKSFR